MDKEQQVTELAEKIGKLYEKCEACDRKYDFNITYDRCLDCLAQHLISSGYRNVNNLTAISDPKTVGEARAICEKYGLKAGALNIDESVFVVARALLKAHNQREVGEQER
jgi:hypothetical protein